jgi:hypothetical protein
MTSAVLSAEATFYENHIVAFSLQCIGSVVSVIASLDKRRSERARRKAVASASQWAKPKGKDSKVGVVRYS